MRKGRGIEGFLHVDGKKARKEKDHDDKLRTRAHEERKEFGVGFLIHKEIAGYGK